MNKSSQTKFKKSNAFTLIEILIATIIFAIVMVMTTGVVGQSVRYQSKIRAVRATSEETRKIADMISGDIREARGSFKIAYNDFTLKTADYTQGIAVFECLQGGNRCLSLNSATVFHNFNINGDEHGGNTLIIVNENKIKIYWLVTSWGKAVYYYEYNLSDLDPNTGEINSKTLDQILKQSADDKNFNLIAGSSASIGDTSTNEMKTAAKIKKSCFSSATVKCGQQAYVEFVVSSELGAPYGLSPDPNYYQTAVRSIATVRNYSN